MTLATEYYETGTMPALFSEQEYVGEEKLVRVDSLLSVEDQRQVNNTRSVMAAMKITGVGERMVLLTRSVPETSTFVRDTRDNSLVTFPLAAGG